MNVGNTGYGSDASNQFYDLSRRRFAKVCASDSSGWNLLQTVMRGYV
jgi:hypothetical protein